MRPYFAEVLARESACLTRVADGVALLDWRCAVVEELMAPQSPYARALRAADSADGRAEFLDRWRELIAETVSRVLRDGAARGMSCPTAPAPRGEVDPQGTAVLILAAIHGGSVLSRLARDAGPLDAALDLALAPLLTAAESAPVSPGPGSPARSVPWTGDDDC